MRNEVLYYNARGFTELHSLKRALEMFVFPHTGMIVREVTQDDFLETVGERTALLVVPGSRAGQAYRDEFGRTRENRQDLHSEQFTKPLFEHLQKQLTAGMNMLGICAGGYVFSRDFCYTEYDPYTVQATKVKEVRSEIALVGAHAYGPDLRLYHIQPREQKNPWTIYSAVGVSFEGIDGQSRDIYMALSKGPSFTDLDPMRCRALARYTDTGDAAIVIEQHGAGRIILCGPEPAIGGDNLSFYDVAPEYRQDPRVNRIMNRLDASREGFGELWCRLLVEFFPQSGYDGMRQRVRKNLVVAPRTRRLLADGAPKVMSPL